jgi:hypothetical protein
MPTATTVPVKMAQRRDTAANWTSSNPTLLAGEIGIESDTNKIKIGTGSTSWTSLSYTPWSQVSTYPFVNADIASAAAIAYSKLATLTSGNIVLGSSANVATSTAVTGDVTISNTGVTAIASGVIVNADINASAAIADTKLDTIATAGKVSNSATTATDANTPSAIIARNASGNFTAGTITAALTGAASSNVLKAGDTMTGVLAVTAGTAALPGITPSGDPNTGIYSPGADQVAISTNGVQRINIEADGDINIDSGGVFYDATNNRLAIGTSSPTFNLVSANSSTDGGWLYSSGSVSTLGLGGYSLAGDGAFQLKYERSAGTITFNGGSRDTPAERLRIDGFGRLLVGTSSGVSAAFVNSSIQAHGITGDTSSVTLYRFTTSATAVATPRLVMARSGSDSKDFTVVASGNRLGQLNFVGADGSQFVSAASIDCEVDGTPGTNDMPGRLVFTTTADGASSPTERMRITSAGVLQVADAGNITVGTTTGTKIGTATTQKIGFYNATPVVQPAAVANATTAVDVITQLNDLLAKLRTLGIIAT